MLYSVVIPCYRSDQTIEHVVDQTREEMVRLGRANVEFVLVNDCSPDGGKTIQVLRKMAAEHRDVKVIDLARNSGQHNALMAALRHADGDVIIGMDDDGQTHPSQLGKLFETFDQGYDSSLYICDLSCIKIHSPLSSPRGFWSLPYLTRSPAQKYQMLC